MADTPGPVAPVAAGDVVALARGLIRGATPGPWHWWTSNSHRRLGTPDHDGNVAYGWQHPHDRVCTIVVSDENAAFIAAAPVLVARLLARLDAVGELIADNGCDCDCEHHPDEHDDYCERCLACHVSAALTGVTLPDPGAGR